MIKNVVVISDLHCGCQFGLCPNIVKLDGGGFYRSSALQKKVFSRWDEFWTHWVPLVTKGEDFIVVSNGDAIDGRHHSATTQISQNLTDQEIIAVGVLSEVVNLPRCAGYYHIRGTEAHGGPAGELEENIAHKLGAVKDEYGKYSRWEMWLEMNRRKCVINFSHHVGVTSSAAYESTAPYKELVENYTEAGKQGNRPADVIVRSHRHRYFKNEVSAAHGNAMVIVTPGWQLKTPFAYRLALGKAGLPQIGGVLIRTGDEDPIYTRNKVWHIQRPKSVIV